MCTKILLALIVPCIYAYKWYPLPYPYTEKCIVGIENQYPPDQVPLPWYIVNLDAPPTERWTEISRIHAAEIQGVMNALKNFTYPFFHGKFFQFVDDIMANWDHILGQPYKDELQGIATASGVPLGEIVLANLFYDLQNLCTSIVAEDPMGRLYHARNMDFGEFLGWNIKTHEWIVTEA